MLEQHNLEDGIWKTLAKILLNTCKKELTKIEKEFLNEK